MTRYFAFYWTFPVPWRGFTALPKQVDAAAKASRTIAFSRDLVRSHVASVGGRLVPGEEHVAIESAPDRGSRELAEVFAGLLDRAGREDAMVAIVDFSGRHRWRSHSHLAELYAHPSCERVEADEDEHMEGGFDPYLHFERWRAETQRKIDGKAGHRAQIRAVLETMPATSWAARASALNALDCRTHNGRPWTADNLRKMLGRPD